MAGRVDHHGMVIDMNEAQVRTLDQVREVLAGTQALEMRPVADEAGRYGWIEQVLKRFDYRCLKRVERGVVLTYVQRISGYSRAQVTRLVSRWVAGKRLVKQYRAPEQAFAKVYTAIDVALLVEVDQEMGTLSGPATACVLRRQRDEFGDQRFARLGSISVGHLYNLRNSAPYRAKRIVKNRTVPVIVDKYPRAVEGPPVPLRSTGDSSTAETTSTATSTAIPGQRRLAASEVTSAA